MLMSAPITVISGRPEDRSVPEELFPIVTAAAAATTAADSIVTCSSYWYLSIEQFIGNDRLGMSNVPAVRDVRDGEMLTNSLLTQQGRDKLRWYQ